MSPRRLAVVVLVALLAAAAVGTVLVFSLGSKPSAVPGSSSTSVSSMPAQGPSLGGQTLTTNEAAGLATALVSENQAAYEAAWTRGVMAPMPPAGTKIAVVSVRSYKTYGRIDATFTMPDTSIVTAIVHLQRVADKWLVHHIEEVK